MKMIRSTTTGPVAEQRDNRIRTMVMGFRERTLTTEDHRELSSWINESEHHEQLFENWIIRDFPRLKYQKTGGCTATADDAHTGIRQITKPLIAIGIFILCIAIILGIYFLFGG